MGRIDKEEINIPLNIIPIKENFDIDVDYLENKIKNTTNKSINIIAITACSNVLAI